MDAILQDFAPASVSQALVSINIYRCPGFKECCTVSTYEG
jgi:hypothetical protein